MAIRASSESQRTCCERVAQAPRNLRIPADPCVTSGEVVARLEAGRIDRGVMALRNAVGGSDGAVDAMRGRALHELARCELEIIHGPYGPPPSSLSTSIRSTRTSRRCASVPGTSDAGIRRRPVSSGGHGARCRALAAGAYPDVSAVICSRAAAERLGSPHSLSLPGSRGQSHGVRVGSPCLALSRPARPCAPSPQ